MRMGSFRGILGLATAGLATVALVVAVALVVVTTRLHDNSRELAASVESLRVTQQLAIDLLLRTRSVDPVVSRDLAASIRLALDEAQGFVTTGREAVVLGEARRSVAAYLAAADRGGPGGQAPADAYAAVAALVDVNVGQARETEARAARWDDLANALGVSAAVTVLVAVIGLVLWFDRRAFRPMAGLGAAMGRFTDGDRKARAEERGPSEVRSMARQFNRMAGSLCEQRSAQTAFLGGVAHDLRSPLAAMKLALECLAADRVIELATQRIDRQIVRVDRMIGDFLDMTQIEARQLRLELATCDVRDLASEVASLFDARAAEHTIYLSIPDHPVLIVGDRLRLEQAMGNLLGNAIKYSPAGTCIHLDVLVEGGHALLEVRDHGVGMSEADREVLFEPFRRVSSGVGVAGIGLGLFVTRGIVEAHRGTIEVESVPRQGSLFRIRVPIAPPGRTRTRTPIAIHLGVDELALRREAARKPVAPG